ncbi:MAG: hypothetical protein ABI305_01425 [Tepidiformaceae bacterium]
MEVGRALYLVSGRGQAALAELEPRLDGLDLNQLSAALRKRHAPDEAAALAEQVTLRKKARERFAEELGMLYSAEGLEMMTHPVVARRRAARLVRLGLPVADLTCGLGGDLRAYRTAGATVLGVEHDAATALLAGANVPDAAIVRADAEQLPFKLGGLAVNLDPSRRSAAGRRFGPDAFSPNWDVSLGLLREAKAGVMKAPPGINHSHLPDEAETEFVQIGRSMREATVWVGGDAVPGLLRAVLLPANVSLDSSGPDVDATCSIPREFVFDPESCATRAGVVRQLGYLLGAQLMDPQVAYLTADAATFHPMAATFEVLEVMPFSVSRLKQRLRESGWRADEVRRRAFPIEPDELRRLLGRMEGDAVTLLLTTLGGKRTVIICRRVRESMYEDHETA